ncbi:SDR family oxidoreductase [Sporosarcina sp. HYO08]|uniref:SDR family oxidoreductase n=1 Tax=Sporosarcina sp. HYO08 TaxID=1759557 RepID=UPI0007931661|nr:SDR family NAD(P)-dependent oxidoreductase [Sporosarcina sp. HYO08]KXH83914.1 alcohol dehydrogenase [Sporosarcina sp. HYO08]
MENGEIVVITGAGSGLGASLARKYSSHGTHVCLLGRTRSKLEKIASVLESDHSIYEVDISSKESVSKVFREIKIAHGSIDCLINNAGVGMFKDVGEITEEEIHQMIDINLKGTIFCTQEVLPVMKEQNSGSIVNIISGSGKVAKASETVYSASKFGVRGFSEALSEELKNTEIHIYGAYMGNMKTNLWEEGYSENQLANYMNPDDVAEIIFENLKPRKHLRVTDITIMNHR